MYDIVATIKLSELLRETPQGEPVNTHVVKVAPEPKPDFAAMRRVVYGSSAPKSEGKPTER